VSRREFDAMVADPDRLSRQVQVSPSGRLSPVGDPRRHPGQPARFRNGDVITAVNGTRLDDELGLLGLYAGLGSTRSYNVTFQRGGATQTRTIRPILRE
jgi:S1-C subfamily serine protease